MSGTVCARGARRLPDGLNAVCWDEASHWCSTGVMSALAFEALLQGCGEHLLKDSSPEVDF